MAVLIPDAIPRPTSNTPAVRDKAIRKLLLKWLKEDSTDEEQIVKQLDEVLDSFNDGFDAAKELENRFYWDADSELDSAKDEAVKAWVKEVQPKPTFKLGDRVIWKRCTENVEGKITKIYAETAQYIVSKDTDASGCGTYVNWEDAEPA